MSRSPCLICGVPTNGPYCPEHQPEYGYSRQSWRRPGGTRQLVLERAGHRCELRVDEACSDEATTVHRLPEFGTYHDTNLDAYVAACAHCHGVVDGRRASVPNAGRPEPYDPRRAR